MKRKGINYDVGTDFIGFMTRPVFDAGIVSREFEIIKNDLYCNAVRISGTDIDHLMIAAEEALKQGLEVWLSPIIHDKNETDTIDYMVKCAKRAELLLQQWPKLIFVLGCELTIFMQGILEGNNVMERLSNPASMEIIKKGIHNERLNSYLAKVNENVRKIFKGQVTYASAQLEAVDWSLFDFVCIDYYREARNKDSYAERLKIYFNYNKPVIITEVGCCTFQGAENEGGRGIWTIFDPTSPDKLKDNYTRDECIQAHELADLLTILEKAGVEGVFVYTFALPALTHNENPRRDLDMASYGLVKCYADKYGMSYPDMRWEPKESFEAVANYFRNTN